MAAAPDFNLEAIIKKLYGLISVDIVINDKVNSVRKDLPAVDAAEITGIVTN